MRGLGKRRIVGAGRIRPLIRAAVVCALATAWAAPVAAALPPPVIGRVVPKFGPVEGGTTVTITNATHTFVEVMSVKFGALEAASFTVNSDNSITAISPPEAAGLVDITVTNPGGTSALTNKDHFKFLPMITNLSPSTGSTAGGTIITMTGTGFGLGKSATKVKFGTPRAISVNCSSSTSCTVVAPAHAAGTVDVKVTVNKVSSAKTPADQFTYS